MVHVWSLYGGEETGVFETQTEKLKEKYSKFNQGKILNTIFYVAIFLFFLGLFVTFIFYFLFSSFLPQFVFAGVFSAVGLYSIVRSYYASYTRDLVKYEVAKEFGWFYEPNPNRTKWARLKKDISEIFNKGNTSQDLDDQFYGKIYSGHHAYDFHSGIFHYGVKNNKSTSHYYRHFFAFRLNRKINSRFFLYPENVGSKIANFFIRKEVDVESVEFNRKFAFSYGGKKGEKEIDILSVISPSMQLKLLELYEKKGAFNVLFADDYVVFDFNGRLINKFKTDFSKSMNIDRGDVDKIKSDMAGLVGIMQEIAGKLH